MEWEVIHRVALQPHIIYILMISCFTSPQIILQNASLFIYILVNHSCFKPLAGRAHGRRFLSLCCAVWSARSWGLPGPPQGGEAVCGRQGARPGGRLLGPSRPSDNLSGCSFEKMPELPCISALYPKMEIIMVCAPQS